MLDKQYELSEEQTLQIQIYYAICGISIAGSSQ